MVTDLLDVNVRTILKTSLVRLAKNGIQWLVEEVGWVDVC